MSWIIWARSGFIGAPLSVRGNRPERPQRALGRSYYTEGVSRAKAVGGFPCVLATHRGTGKRVVREDGAAHDCKKTAAQRLNTTTSYRHSLWRSAPRVSFPHPFLRKRPSLTKQHGRTSLRG